MRSYVDKIVGWMLNDEPVQADRVQLKYQAGLSSYGRVIHPCKQKELCVRITERIHTEDYKCYMPEEWHIEKPRVRHKLRTYYAVRSIIGVRYSRFGNGIFGNRQCVWK